MSTNPHPAAHRRSLSLGWRHGLVWLLCLCTWRGPVPVVHCHSHAGEHAESAWHQAEHIATCHAGDSDQHGWHLHFVLPGVTEGADSNEGLPSTIDLDQLITHDEPDQHLDVPATRLASDPGNSIFSAPNQPALSPSAPKLIPLAPPRNRPSRVSPRIYYCVAQC